MEDLAVESKPAWFTPRRLLVIFCVINLLNYIDRGTIASNGVNGRQKTCTENGVCESGSGIQGDFKLNNFQDGVLSSAFMVGLLIASPIFASLAKSHNPFRLIGVGLLVWTLATLGCGFSFEFWSLAICRMFVGVGEASFISLAAPFIDDNAPPAQKTAWLAAFYMCIPSGVALGYVYGGLVGSHFSWRYAFWGESILMFPFVIFGFVSKPLQLKGFGVPEKKESLPRVPASAVQEVPGFGVPEKNESLPSVPASAVQEVPGQALVSEETTVQNQRTDATVNSNEVATNNPSLVSSKIGKVSSQVRDFTQDLKYLLVNKVYVINVVGYIAYNFVIGAYSYWGPKAGYAIYHMKDADMMFGGITIICGVFGTLAGGLILDLINSTISNAFKVLSGATFLGAIFCFGAFCSPKLYGFIVLFSIGELLVFATQAPVNYVCLHCVKPSMRPLSMALSTVSIHIFGDVPSSPLVGVLQDHVNNWRETALILTSILFIASVFWFIGIFFRSIDRFNEESEPHEPSSDGASMQPSVEVSV